MHASDSMSDQNALPDLRTVRHDLKNVMSALSSGCVLIDAKLGNTPNEEIRLLLSEMNASAKEGLAIVERLGDLEARDAVDGKL